MKLNKNGKLARFYKWSYSAYELPDNFCNFFWCLVLAIVPFPLTWGTYSLPDDPPLSVRAVLGLIFDLILALLAWGIYNAILQPFEALKIISVIGGGLISIIAGGATCFYLKNRFFSRNEDSIFTEISDVAVEKIKSVKENYCPKIDWL